MKVSWDWIKTVHLHVFADPTIKRLFPKSKINTEILCYEANRSAPCALLLTYRTFNDIIKVKVRFMQLPRVDICRDEEESPDVTKRIVGNADRAYCKIGQGKVPQRQYYPPALAGGQR